MNRYKITLSSNTVYKEIELTPDAQQIKVGTGVDCDIRLCVKICKCCTINAVKYVF